MQTRQRFTSTQVGIFFALLFGAVGLLALGFQLGGYSNPDLAKACYVLAALCSTGALAALLVLG